jgi:hypothetical protein
MPIRGRGRVFRSKQVLITPGFSRPREVKTAEHCQVACAVGIADHPGLVEGDVLFSDVGGKAGWRYGGIGGGCSMMPRPTEHPNRQEDREDSKPAAENASSETPCAENSEYSTEADGRDE